MGILKIYKPADDHGGGSTVGHLIRVFKTGTNTQVAEYAPAFASPITDPFQQFEASLPDGNYDIEYINPNLVESIINPRIFVYESSKGWQVKEYADTANINLTAGKSHKFTNIPVGIDNLFLDAANRKLSTTLKAKVLALGDKVYGSPDGTAKTFDGVTIPQGSSYLPQVKFQDITTSADLGTSLTNSNAYPQFSYYLAPSADGTAPTNVYIPVNNATGAYTRLKPGYSPTKGTAKLEPDGKLTFTPTVGATGNEVVQYQIMSSYGEVLSESTETITISAQGQTLTPKFKERAYGLSDTIKVLAPSGVVGGTCKLLNEAGTVLATATDSTGSGFVTFSGISLSNGQKIKATWTEANKTESVTSALLTVYNKPTAIAKTISTAYNTPITVNVLDGDSNVANMPYF